MTKFASSLFRLGQILLESPRVQKMNVYLLNLKFTIAFFFFCKKGSHSQALSTQAQILGGDVLYFRVDFPLDVPPSHN